MTPLRLPPVPASPADVADAITCYVPAQTTCSAEEWAYMGDFVCDLVRRLQPQTVAAARKYLTKIARYVAHRLRSGARLERAEMLTHSQIEEQISVWRSATAPALANVGLTHRSLDSEASFLRSKGPVLNPLGGFPPKVTRGQRADLQAPYTATDIAGFQDLFWTPGSEPTWSLHRTLLALGHGVGAARSEAITVKTNEILPRHDGLAAVRLPHPDGTTVEVPVAPPYSTWLLMVAQLRGPDTTLLPSAGWSNSGELDRPIPSFLPALTLTRLRTTWLTERIAAGVSPRQLLRYGRYSTYGFMTSLARYIPDLPDADLDMALISRGANHA